MANRLLERIAHAWNTRARENRLWSAMLGATNQDAQAFVAGALSVLPGTAERDATELWLINTPFHTFANALRAKAGARDYREPAREPILTAPCQAAQQMQDSVRDLPKALRNSIMDHEADLAGGIGAALEYAKRNGHVISV